VKRFLAGFLAGTIFLALAVGVVVRFGLADVRADAAIPSWYDGWLSTSIHRSVKREASALTTLAPATDEELIAGGKLFLNDCVGCHGEPGKPPSDFGATFYPHAPQLALTGTSYTPTQIFWIAKNGIRRTGMASQSDSYSDEKLRLLAMFISRMRTLPPHVDSAIHRKPEAHHPDAAQAAEPKK
jgi:cytochrome c553